MKINKNYIEMCKKAQEIQELKNKSNHNYYFPCQNQLQKIYLNKITECLKNKNLKIPDSIFDLMISIFADYLKEVNHNPFNNNWDLVKEETRKQFKYYYENLNMEIIWLEFIMLHIFNKKWNFINKNWEIFK